MHGWGGNGWWWGGWIMWIFMILFWVLIIIGTILLIRWLASRPLSEIPFSEARQETALEVLKKRYAKGEITREQYLEMRRDLEEHPEPPG